MSHLVLNTSLTLQCILTETNEQGCFRPLILSQGHYYLSHVVLTPRPLCLAREYPDNSYLLGKYVRGPAYSHIDYWLLCLCLRVFSCPIKHAPLDQVIECGWKHCARQGLTSFDLAAMLRQLKWILVSKTSAYWIHSQQLCISARKHMAGLLATSWLGVLCITLLDREKLRDMYSFNYHKYHHPC